MNFYLQILIYSKTVIYKTLTVKAFKENMRDCGKEDRKVLKKIVSFVRCQSLNIRLRILKMTN